MGSGAGGISQLIRLSYIPGNLQTSSFFYGYLQRNEIKREI